MTFANGIGSAGWAGGPDPRTRSVVRPSGWPVELVCPRDSGPLEVNGSEAACDAGHRYPLDDGVPVLLVEEDEPTHGACSISVEEEQAPPVAAGG